MKKSNTALLIFFGLPLFSTPAWAWFAEGHQIVAIIAADDLTPAARSHVARILGVHADTASVQKAMASASIRPDTDLRDQDPSTAQWHFINICLQDKEADLRARCPQGNCVSAKIEEYAQRLRDQNYDQWGAAGDLAFLIHFVADIHQPLHTATNADLGGTCQQVKVEPAEPNLHFVWDDAVVLALEKQLGTHDPSATARRLESLYPAGSNFTWKRGESERIALAVTSVGKHGSIWGAGHTGEAVRVTFMRRSNEEARCLKRGLHQARQSDCRSSVGESGPSPRGITQWDLVLLRSTARAPVRLSLIGVPTGVLFGHSRP